MLKELEDKKDRHARFRTIITLIGRNEYQVFEGIVRGTILHRRSGVGGFGYDPVFQPEGFSKTLAQMSMDEKNSISHRGQAVRKLVEYLRGTRK